MTQWAAESAVLLQVPGPRRGPSVCVADGSDERFNVGACIYIFFSIGFSTGICFSNFVFGPRIRSDNTHLLFLCV